MTFENGRNARRILVTTAVEAEREAVLRGLGESPAFDVVAVGVGPAAAAAGTARMLARQGASYGLVVCAGIGGGFAGRAKVGELALSSEIVAADLGAESPDGFLSVDELGFGSSRVSCAAEWTEPFQDALAAAGIPVRYGPILTVSTATGTAETAERRSALVPGAVAEAMEGFGVAEAARACGIPVLEMRAISNAVGPRDRASWRIGEALELLRRASAILAEVLS